jgi:transcriptional regulator with XRE-family HTH domain
MTKSISQLVGENIARHRTVRGWDQEELARRVAELQDAGRERRFSRASISHIESAQRSVNLNDLTLIAIALEQPIGALLLLPEVDADRESIDRVRVDGDREFSRDLLDRQGDALDPESPAQTVLELGRGLAMLVGEAESFAGRVDDLHSLAMSARVKALRQVQASKPELSGD